MKFVRTLLTAAAIAAAAATAFAQETSPATDSAAGLASWAKVYEVFSHPRCANCHVEDDRPRWSSPHYGATRVHAFNVQRGADGSGFGNPGLRCTTCHFASNSSVLHGPPGAEGWHLAPPEMVWFGKSSAEVCAQIKDPARNGGRTLDEVAVHVRDDGLVAWGWNPGPGREPAPGSAQATFEALSAWAAAGAPCP
ncbi:hypothetical protein [Mesorhizobium sp. J428]|uniref:hypothetical protein n=1 Tax=Mesorhizobium sp. J428 TaxID=2898440 RepID=UPI002151E3B4|nr:hypothetical protein [Mesorhizobium sp. J428]MCR5857058.1 hypothetical protein [Mesorhizobium sp. J428]